MNTSNMDSCKQKREFSECHVHIHIDNKGSINIYNCTTPPSNPADPLPLPTDQCIPIGLGAKPKQTRRRKLDKLLANTRVPSALGASFFHLTRRFLAGKTPANLLEERAFTTLQQLPSDLQRVLTCARDSFDLLSSNERNRLFASDLLRDIDQPLETVKLAQAFDQEILGNIGITVFGAPDCIVEERPGKVRTQPFPGGEFPPSQVRICRINSLRTGAFIPRLNRADYAPAELQQQCRTILEGNIPKLVCEVQTTNCLGTEFDGVCLRVQEVEAGQLVILEGVNFSSIDTKVHIKEIENFTNEQELQAHVCGDDQTPLTEIINGQEVPILDCRVHDRLTFRIPDELTPGLYEIRVVVPNVGGVPGWGNFIGSDGERIMVLPPSTARFQITSETMRCIKETSPGFLGSDEVGIKILSVPLFPDLSNGELQVPNGGQPIRFGDVDSDETRAMDHLLFSHQQPIIGAALVVSGFEVDSEEAFERQIDGFSEAFVEILKDEIAFLKDHLKEATEIAQKLKDLGAKGLIAAAVGIAIVLAIDVFVALWAPADPIIEDAIGPTILELVQLTSDNFPMPLPSEHITAQGIKVKVTPLDKVPHQYREKREYISDDEESHYEIVLRYNRLV